MTDKPHRLLFADLSAPGETGDRRDAGAVECLSLLGEAEFFEQTAEVPTDLLVPWKGFFLLGGAQLRNQGGECRVEGRDQEPVPFGDKCDGSRLFIDSGKGHRGLAQAAALMECNFEGDAHPVGQIGERQPDELNVLGGEFRAFLHAGHLDPESGSDILLNMTPFQCLKEDCPEDSEVKKCGGGRTFSEAGEPDLASIIVFDAEFSGNLRGDNDAAFIEKIGEDAPDLQVFFGGLSVFCAVDPKRNPIREMFSDKVWTTDFGNRFFHFQGAGLTRFAKILNSQTGRFSMNQSLGSFVFYPPVRGVFSLVKRGHEKKSMCLCVSSESKK